MWTVVKLIIGLTQGLVHGVLLAVAVSVRPLCWGADSRGSSQHASDCHASVRITSQTSSVVKDRGDFGVKQGDFWGSDGQFLTDT